jgi:hypothetical protein
MARLDPAAYWGKHGRREGQGPKLGGPPRKPRTIRKVDRMIPNFENLAETLATFVTLASIQLALRRLARA